MLDPSQNVPSYQGNVSLLGMGALSSLLPSRADKKGEMCGGGRARAWQGVRLHNTYPFILTLELRITDEMF